MITINKAILHILDFNSNITVFSEKELNIGNTSVETFLTKHLEKIQNDQNGKVGAFSQESNFKKQLLSYGAGSLSFLDFSMQVANVMYSIIAKSDKPDSTDLLFCDINADSERFVAILKCDNKVGFTHQVIRDNDGVRNDIINHYAIMPTITQKIDEYALIDLSSADIKFSNKKRSIDGQENYIFADNILECSSGISPKETISSVNTIAGKVAENHGQSSVKAVSKAKNYVRDNTEISDYLNPIELGEEISAGSQIMQQEYAEEVKRAGMADNIKIDKSFALKAGKSHKIRTDTGIEITIPVDYFQNTDFIEFVNNPDGTLSIELKNIGKLINK